MPLTYIDVALVLIAAICLWRANSRRVHPEISYLYTAVGLAALLLLAVLLLFLPDPVREQMLLR